jgi:LysR family transcriptional regulator, glycine cleavage system transcriptional activator
MMLVIPTHQSCMALPSLRSLQIFEKTAQCESFRAAADALFLTHGAVSRQIRALEVELGFELFARSGRRAVLTPAGRRLQSVVAEALELIGTSVSELRQQAKLSAARLSVTVLPAFATRWLMPRIADFEARHPDIALELIATIAPLDLAAKQIALGIRNGSGKWDRLTAERLAVETQFPVAAASGIAGCASLPESVHEIPAYPLLNPYDDWETWFRHAGVSVRGPSQGTTYEDASLLLKAAEQGAGIALGRKWLVADALKVGTLVRLPGPAIASRRDYYLVRPEDQPLSPAAHAFASWLHEQMREEPE